MFDIRFEINGRPIRREQLGNALEAAMLDAVSDQIRERVGALRCPVHHEYARISAGRSTEKLRFTIEGCCEDLVGQMRAAFA